MFSKEESAKLRKDFWVSYGKSFPRKWLLYNTKVKGFSFKFDADRKQAFVCLDIDSYDEVKNLFIYDQLLSLKTILTNDFIPKIIYDDAYLLDNGKIIYRIYVKHTEKFSIHNKNTWRSCYKFFNDKMALFELFYHEYEDVIKNF